MDEEQINTPQNTEPITPSVDDTDSPPPDEKVFDIADQSIQGRAEAEGIVVPAPEPAEDPAQAAEQNASVRKQVEESLEQEFAGAKLNTPEDPLMAPQQMPIQEAESSMPYPSPFTVPQQTEEPKPEVPAKPHIHIPADLPKIPAINANFKHDASGLENKTPSPQAFAPQPTPQPAATEPVTKETPASTFNNGEIQTPSEVEKILQKNLLRRMPAAPSTPSSSPFVIPPPLETKIDTRNQAGPILTRNNEKPEIPLREVPGINRMKTAPANPPAKTLGGLHEDKIAQAEQAKDLQSAVSAMIPGQTENTNSFVKKIPVASDPKLKALRTYEGDVAEAMAHKKTTVASIAIAESKKATGQEIIENAEPEETPQSPGFPIKNLLMILVILVLLGGGAFGAYYLYTVSPLANVGKTEPVSIPQVYTSLIPSDSQKVISADGLGQKAIIAKISSESDKKQPGDSIKELILTHNVKGQEVRITGPEMLDIMDLKVPDVLSRSLSDLWMLGVYEDENEGKSLFIVATNNFFQNAFAGMLQWEPLMADDLKQFIYPEPVSGIANAPRPASSTSATSTGLATSTAIEQEYQRPANFTLRGQFQDRIIRNKDVRAFITSDGHTLFMYSFIDNNRLVITKDETALNRIISRLEKQSFVR